MKIFKKIKYTLLHWFYFQLTAFKLHTWKPRFLLHDLDKIYLIIKLNDTKKASQIHRKNSNHHTESNSTNPDYLQMVIDWECARYTKLDKPLNARQTLNKYYPELTDTITPILNSLNL